MQIIIKEAQRYRRSEGSRGMWQFGSTGLDQNLIRGLELVS